MLTPTLPSDRDTFDKTLLVSIFLVLLLCVVWFGFKAADEKDSSWARETATGVVGALLMKINSDRKQGAPGIPDGGSSTTTTTQSATPAEPVK